MTIIAQNLVLLKKDKEAEKWFQKTRKVGEAHGLFTLECSACMGLGQV